MWASCTTQCSSYLLSRAGQGREVRQARTVEEEKREGMPCRRLGERGERRCIRHSSFCLLETIWLRACPPFPPRHIGPGNTPLLTSTCTRARGEGGSRERQAGHGVSLPPSTGSRMPLNWFEFELCPAVSRLGPLFRSLSIYTLPCGGFSTYLCACNLTSPMVTKK